jgi:uncharacterized membrane-anchored protein YjiN (DUF445 family)
VKPGGKGLKNLADGQARSLRKMKALATGLLAGMTVTYGLSRYFESRYPFLGLVASFSEAAMVGALADWFAVVALFRHPLGLPIPRTAVVPKNKERIGDALAKFIRDSFLTREVLEKKLASVDLAGFAAHWLSNGRNARKLADQTGIYVPAILERFNDRDLQAFVREEVMANIKKMKLTPVIAAVVRPLAEGDLHQNLLTEMVRLGDRLLQENKATLREFAKKESPRYIPDFIDEKIFNKLVAKVEEALAAVEHDPQHEVRAKFTEAFRRFVEKVEHSEEFRARIEDLKTGFLENPNVKGYIASFWTSVKTRTIASLGDPASLTRRQMAKSIQELGRAITKDEGLQEKINQLLRTWCAAIISQNRERLVSLVSETVRIWDPKETSRRIELNIGKDLQWIRVNGTVIGGMVGLLIYAISRLLHHVW